MALITTKYFNQLTGLILEPLFLYGKVYQSKTKYPLQQNKSLVMARAGKERGREREGRREWR